jgi:hypothetical protein
VVISVAGPRMQESLNISPEAWGRVVGIFTVLYAVVEIRTGRMGEQAFIIPAPFRLFYTDLW